MSDAAVNPPATAEVPTPMQRDHATTIYERSVAGPPRRRDPRLRRPRRRRARSTS